MYAHQGFISSYDSIVSLSPFLASLTSIMNIGRLYSISDVSGGNFALWAAETTSGIISLLSSIVVLSSYFFILWYRPPMVNRISLRLIVFSCFCTIVFICMHYATETISNQSNACRVIVYFMIISDIMACMCLAMVGLNLVMIFIVRVANPARMEKYYYIFICLTAVIGALVPLASRFDVSSIMEVSCW